MCVLMGFKYCVQIEFVVNARMFQIFFGQSHFNLLFECRDLFGRERFFGERSMREILKEGGAPPVVIMSLKTSLKSQTNIVIL